MAWLTCAAMAACGGGGGQVSQVDPKAVMVVVVILFHLHYVMILSGLQYKDTEARGKLQ